MLHPGKRPLLVVFYAVNGGSSVKKEDVPQDHSHTYAGHKKVIYALNAQGIYEKVESSGWATEEYATLMAVNDLRRLALEAYQRGIDGITSPLEYYMHHKRLDVVGLSQATGFFQWQIKRHLRPKTFAKLSRTKLSRYSEALGIRIEELQTLPEEIGEYGA
jgi:hypothetical protein